MMGRSHQLLVNLTLVLSLLLPGLASAASNPSGPAQTSRTAPAARPGDGAQQDLAGKRAKRKRERRQDRRQHDRKTDRKHDRKKSKHEHNQKQQHRKRARRARELATGILPGADVVAPPPGEPISAENHYIVKLREGAGDELNAAESIAAGLDGIVPTHVYRYVFSGFAAVIPPDKLDDVRADPRVEAVVPDRVVHAFAQFTPTGIRRIDADQNPTADIDGVDERVDVDVAVVDTAGHDTHPDLNVWTWANCTPSHNNSDDDDHGTHVGGTIGALDNNVGVVGVAPGARLWNIRVLVNGSGLDSWIICGMDLVTKYAVDRGDGYGDLEVANLSLGGGGSDSDCATEQDDVFHQAFCHAVDAGVTVVVAAGNDGADAATQTPAAYDEVITVSALADSDGQPGGLGGPTSSGFDDTRADFSNFGADVDIAAPGVDITSTVPGGYDTFSGTSMASPHVAGAAALYLATHPGETPEQVKEALQNASEQGTLPEGVLNVGPGSGIGAAASAREFRSSADAVAARAAPTTSDKGKRGKRHGKAKSSKGQRHRR